MAYVISPLREVSQRGTGDVTAAELGHPKPGASLPTVPKTRLQSPRDSLSLSRVRWKFNPRDGWSWTEQRDERGTPGQGCFAGYRHAQGVFCKASWGDSVHTSSIAQLCPVPVSAAK